MNSAGKRKPTAEDQQTVSPIVIRTVELSGDPGLTVHVSLAPSLARDITPGAILFVYARAVSGPPMPLAIKRLEASDLPATVTLADADGVMPTMRLSSARQVVVAARVSASGNAMPQSGDLEGESAPIDLPHGAVVIAACLSFADVLGMFEMYRLRKVEFALSVISFLGVAFIGVIEGIFITIGLALLVLVWNAWHPHWAILARVDGAKGFHDITRHPEGRQVPGLLLFRWDAQLFFANAELFREQILGAVASAPTPIRWVVVAADAITDVDITAADVLLMLHGELDEQGVTLMFAGMKGPVKDRLRHYGTLETLGSDIFEPTVGSAVNRYRAIHPVDWKDWDET